MGYYLKKDKEKLGMLKLVFINGMPKPMGINGVKKLLIGLWFMGKLVRKNVFINWKSWLRDGKFRDYLLI